MSDDPADLNPPEVPDCSRSYDFADCLRKEAMRRAEEDPDLKGVKPASTSDFEKLVQGESARINQSTHSRG